MDPVCNGAVYFTAPPSKKQDFPHTSQPKPPMNSHKAQNSSPNNLVPHNSSPPLPNYESPQSSKDPSMKPLSNMSQADLQCVTSYHTSDTKNSSSPTTSLPLKCESSQPSKNQLSSSLSSMQHTQKSCTGNVQPHNHRVLKLQKSSRTSYTKSIPTVHIIDNNDLNKGDMSRNQSLCVQCAESHTIIALVYLSTIKRHIKQQLLNLDSLSV
jgi:hypothetical protein